MNGAQITFFGRVTREPELRYTANDGISFTTLGVAVNTYRQNRETETNYFDVTLWRARAEAACVSCHRGTMVFVQGRFSQREYQHRDGKPGVALQVDATEFRNLTPAAPQSPADPDGTDGTANPDSNPQENVQNPQGQAEARNPDPDDFASDIDFQQETPTEEFPH